MNQFNEFQEIKKILPKQYAQKLRKRIIDKHGVTYHFNYIQQVMNGKNWSLNSLIVKEAILWAEEIIREHEEFTQKMENLKTV